LNGPAYYEAAIGDVGSGTIVLTAPSGFVFDTGAPAPALVIFGDGSHSKNINGANSGSTNTVTATSTTLTFTVSSRSSSPGTPNYLIWQNVRVRPTAISPLANGNI